MKRKWIFVITPFFLTVILACVVPGLSTSPTPIPTLTADTGAMQTMVVGTVSAAIAQTQQSMPTPSPVLVIVTAPVTPTETATPTSTATATSTVTSTAASTATATQNPSQSLLGKQGDGTTLFTDKLAHYRIKLPANWLTLRINEKEYQDAFSLKEASNTNIQQALLGVQKEDPNILRLYAFDPVNIQNDFVSDMRFVLDKGVSLSLNTDEDLQAIAGKIPASAEVFRFEVTSVKMGVSDSGVKFGIIETRSSFTNAGGIEIGLYQKRVYFNAPAGRQSIVFTTVTDLKDTFLPAFDTMLRTIEVVTE